MGSGGCGWENDAVPDSGSNTLAGIDLLAGLTPEQLSGLERLCRWKRYPARAQIIDRQSETRDVFFIVSGRVRVVNYSVSGQEITFSDMAEGGHFGELAALDGQPRSASVMALSDSLIASIPPKHFLGMLEKYPSVALKVMVHLAQMVRITTDRVMDLSTLGATNRVHADLLRRAQEFADGGNQVVIHPIPVHGDIASRVSTTRETVARVMNDLARQGIVERMKDTCVIRDMKRLLDMVEEIRGD